MTAGWEASCGCFVFLVVVAVVVVCCDGAVDGLAVVVVVVAVAAAPPGPGMAEVQPPLRDAPLLAPPPPRGVVLPSPLLIDVQSHSFIHRS